MRYIIVETGKEKYTEADSIHHSPTGRRLGAMIFTTDGLADNVCKRLNKIWVQPKYKVVSITVEMELV